MMELRAHAKINLHLRSLRRRPDGYHELATVFCHLDLDETVQLEPLPGQIRLESSLGLAVEQDLAGRAAIALRQAMGDTSLGCAIHIDKRLPTGGGLGGGSADAAAVLRGLHRLWRAPWPRIMRVAASLGADVPFLLRGGLADAGGIGDQLSPLTTACAPIECLLLFPGVPVATPQAYAWLDEDGLDEDHAGKAQHDALLQALGRGDEASIVAALYNGFDAPVRRRVPAIDAAMSAAEATGGRVMLCGSGSTLALFGAPPEALQGLKAWNPTPARLSGFAGMLAKPS